MRLDLAHSLIDWGYPGWLFLFEETVRAGVLWLRSTLFVVVRYLA